MPTGATRKPKRRRSSPRRSSASRNEHPLDAILRLIPGFDPWATAAPGDWIDYDAAQHVIDFFHECVTHVKGEKAGQPFRLEPWQQAVVGNLFGWKRADGTRRFRELFLYVPRKNGKTALLGGLVLYVGLCDGEQGAEIYSAAADSDQANLIYQQAAGMAAKDSFLKSQTRVFKDKIFFPASTSRYEAIDAKAYTKHGFNAHAVFFDEVHAQTSDELWDVLETSMGARRQPLMVGITTADFDRPSLCNRKLQYAEGVRDGRIHAPEFLPVIYATLRDADWTSEAVWRAANPNFGISIKPDYIAEKCRKAQTEPSYENTFKRLFLNMPTEQEERWLPMAKWDECRSELNESELVGRKCWAALDCSQTSDITALVFVFPWEDEEGFDILAKCWVPKKTVEERASRNIPYDVWAREKWLTVIPGDWIDFERVKRETHEACKRFMPVGLAFDKWRAQGLEQSLTDDYGLPVIDFAQTYNNYHGACKTLEKLWCEGRLNHGGNPVLRWMFGNMVLKTSNDQKVMPDKKRRAEKIDAAVATLMAIGISQVEKPKKPSVYETREPLVF